MNKKTLLMTMLALFILNMLSVNIVGVSATPVSPYIAVDPSSQTIMVGWNFTVAIRTDYDGYDVWGWTIRLTFSPAVLGCIEVRNGDLVTEDIDPSAEFHSTFNNTVGEVLAGADFYYTTPPPFVTSGPGTLAYVTFKGVGTGYSNITLEKDTKLLVYDSVTQTVKIKIEAGLQPDQIGHGTAMVTLLGDVDINRKVNVADLIELSKAYGSTAGPPPSPNWNSNCDLNRDKKVQASDLFYLGKNYGKSW